MPRGATHWASGSRTRRRRERSAPPSCCASACSAAFPRGGRARARVLWRGAGGGERESAALAARVERIVGAAGFVAERRAPSAHLTLSRLDPPRPLGSLLG